MTSGKTQFPIYGHRSDHPRLFVRLPKRVVIRRCVMAIDETIFDLGLVWHIASLTWNKKKLLERLARLARRQTNIFILSFVSTTSFRTTN